MVSHFALYKYCGIISYQVSSPAYTYGIDFSAPMNFIFLLSVQILAPFRRYPFHLFLLEVFIWKLLMCTLASTECKHRILGIKRKYQNTCQKAKDIIYN